MGESKKYLDETYLGSYASPYARLERYLMAKYNKKIIPRKTPKKSVDVTLNMQLYQIVAIVIFYSQNLHFLQIWKIFKKFRLFKKKLSKNPKLLHLQKLP